MILGNRSFLNTWPDSRIGFPRNDSIPDSIGVWARENCVVNKQSKKQKQRDSRGELVCLSGFIGLNSIYVGRCNNAPKRWENCPDRWQFGSLDSVVIFWKRRLRLSNKGGHLFRF